MAQTNATVVSRRSIAGTPAQMIQLNSSGETVLPSSAEYEVSQNAGRVRKSDPFELFDQLVA